MLYVQVVRSFGKVVSARALDGYSNEPGVESRNHWKSLEEAGAVAMALGSEYIATDAGPNVSPRYDVQRLPKVGDLVSKRFNGDSYWAGIITRVSPSLKMITTDTGEKFFRVRKTGSWRNEGTWFLVPREPEERNPSF